MQYCRDTSGNVVPSSTILIQSSYAGDTVPQDAVFSFASLTSSAAQGSVASPSSLAGSRDQAIKTQTILFQKHLSPCVFCYRHMKMNSKEGAFNDMTKLCHAQFDHHRNSRARSKSNSERYDRYLACSSSTIC